LRDYIIICAGTIFFATISFFSEINSATEVSLMILFSGILLTFLNWKRNSPLVKKIIDNCF